MGFENKKYHFCILFAWTTSVAIFHKKYEKVLKTTQSVPKTVDNHQEKFRISIYNKNAIETPFLAVSSPQKGMRGIPIGFWEKSNFFGSIGSLKGAKIAIFVQGGH